MVVRNRKFCAYCKRLFELEKSSQDFCSYECEQHSRGLFADVQKKYKHETNCIICKCKIATNYNGKYCSDECKYTNVKNKKYENKQKQIKDANERWLLEKPKKKGKSLDYLIKQSEYKRVFDDRGWDHYLRGRKWDRI